MVQRKRFPAVAAAVLALGGCSVADEALWPSLTGEDPAPPAGTPVSSVSIQPSTGELSGSPLIEPGYQGTSVVGAPSVAPGAPTGTFVGAKIATLRGESEGLKQSLAGKNAELQQLLNATSQNSQRYHAIIAAISARLQVGTTPGNPVLVSQWQSAQVELDRVVQDSSKLSELSNRIASDLGLARYLVESTRAAYTVQGAVDEDHRQLAILEDDVNRTTVSIDRLLNQVNEAVARQNSYVTGERRNLGALALAISNGEAYGPSLSTLSYAQPAGLAQTAAAPATGSVGGLQAAPPLVIIRFDNPNVAYEQALYDAVSLALENRPSASFDLVAVTPNRGTPSQVGAAAGDAKENAQRVLRSLLAMGLPADRVNLQSASSNTALSNEVHVYVR